MAIKVGTGEVLTARSYSSNGYENYQSRYKSFAIGSGANQMAYVISLNREPGVCFGQHFIKFDPTTLTVYPSGWIKKTISTASCGGYGLTFGR